MSRSRDYQVSAYYIEQHAYFDIAALLLHVAERIT